MADDTSKLGPYTLHQLKLGVRLLSLVVVVSVLTIHVRSVRVFRWEQFVSGGVLVTSCMALLGLALCTGIKGEKSSMAILQAYLCIVCGALLALNAFVIWRRWRHAGELTHAMAELLQTLGVRIKRHVLIKVSLCGVAAGVLFVDLVLSPLLNLI